MSTRYAGMPRERFFQLLDSANHMLWCLDAQGRFCYVGEAVRTLLGYEPETLIGETVELVLTQTAAEEVRTLLNARMIPSPSAVRLELLYRRNDGSEFWGEVHAHPILDDQDRLVEIHGITRNIREHARFEAAAQDSEGMLCGVLRAVPFGVGVVRDGKMVWENDQMVGLTGYLHQETGGLSARILFQGDLEWQNVRNSLLQAITKTGTGSVETRLTRKDGSLIDVVVVATRANLSNPSSDVIVTVKNITDRKQMEEALRKSERKYRELVENANSIILRMDANGRVTFFNEFAQRFFGYAEKEILGRNVVGTIVPETEFAGRDLFAMIEDIGRNPDEYVNNENENMCRDGTRVWISWTNKPLVDNHGQCVEILCIGNDITERKRAEEELQFRNVLLSTQQEASIDGILVVDEKGRILSYNRRFVEMWGIPAELVEVRDDDPLLRFVTTQVADPEDFMQRVHYLYEHTQETSREELILADGRVFDRYSAPVFGPNERYYGRVWYFRDISARKRAEMALVESERLSRTIVNGSPIPAFIIGKDHSVIHWNKALEELSGIQAEELVGTRQHWKAFYRYERPCLADLVLSGDMHGISDWYVGKCSKSSLIEGAYEGTDFFPDLGDSGRWLRSIAAVIRDSQGQVVGAMETLEDITLRKRAEEEKEKLEAQLRQAQKMEAVGQLAGGIAHDFNNLLQVILGYTDVLQVDLGKHAVHAEALDTVRQAAGRAVDLTRQLLLFSRRQVLQPVNLNLNDLVGGVLKMIRPVIGEHIDLRFKLGERLGTVHVDKGQMEQILMNLCVNARDAMPDGGTLTIETENAVICDEYRQDHPWVAEGPYVLFRVSDTGHGMDETTRARIFEPFFTTKDVGQGTGLGLATVYGIVKQHNGFIHVYSEPDKGSVFNVYIPSVQRAAEAVETQLEEAAVGGTETILVAEDEELVRSLTSRVLQSAGYSVLTACDGEDALRIFEGHADAIDLVLLDVMMPKLNGRAVMDHIHARCPRIRFLFTSGYSANAIHTNFVIKEGLRLITKPYSRVDLLRAVRERFDTVQP